MKSALSFRGHPIHVILVDFPIALWVASLLADGVYLWRGEAYWLQVARDLMAAGLAFAVLAALTGAVDYFKSVPPYSDARSTARNHGLLNGAVTLLYAFNLWWRLRAGVAGDGEWWIGFGLSVVAVGLLTYSGWLGGELVYRYHMGVRRVGVESRPTIYNGSVSAEPGSHVQAVREDELEPGQMKHVIVNGAWLVLARTEEGFHAFDGICTHEGGPLCDGALVDATVQCPWHGSRFDVRTGEVEAGPAKEALHTYAVRVEGGHVLVEAPEGSRSMAAAG